MKKQTLALIIAAISMPSMAENTSILDNITTEFLVGSSSQESIIASGNSLDNSDLKLSGKELSAGFRVAYQMTEYLSAELSYNAWGSTRHKGIYDASGPDEEEPEYERRATKFATDSINLGFKANIPLQNGFSINARAGLAKWNFDSNGIDSIDSDSVYSFDDDGSDIYYGVGLQYEINKDVFIALEGSVMTFDVKGNKITTTMEDDVEQIATSALTADQEIKNISLSLGFRF